LEKNLQALDHISEAGGDTKFLDYTSQIVNNCVETIELMLWRALRELRETYEMTGVRKILKRVAEEESSNATSTKIGVVPSSIKLRVVSPKKSNRSGFGEEQDLRKQALVDEKALKHRVNRLSITPLHAAEMLELEGVDNSAKKQTIKQARVTLKAANKKKVLQQRKESAAMQDITKDHSND